RAGIEAVDVLRSGCPPVNMSACRPGDGGRPVRIATNEQVEQRGTSDCTAKVGSDINHFHDASRDFPLADDGDHAVSSPSAYPHPRSQGALHFDDSTNPSGA